MIGKTIRLQRLFHGNVNRDEWHDLIKRGCRILCELGADMIKTFYTDERFEEITASVPIPIFILGSKKMPREGDVLELAQSAVAAGARGVAIGRNIFQAQNPKKMIMEVYTRFSEPLSHYLSYHKDYSFPRSLKIRFLTIKTKNFLFILVL